jgi:hypothetical protein
MVDFRRAAYLLTFIAVISFGGELRAQIPAAELRLWLRADGKVIKNAAGKVTK